MTYSPRVQVGLQASTVALRAKSGQMTGADVEELQAVAEQLLRKDDALFLAVSDFATQYLLITHDPAAIAERGAWLLDAIERATRPDPVDYARCDIHG